MKLSVADREEIRRRIWFGHGRDAQLSSELVISYCRNCVAVQLLPRSQPLPLAFLKMVFLSALPKKPWHAIATSESVLGT